MTSQNQTLACPCGGERVRVYGPGLVGRFYWQCKTCRKVTEPEPEVDD